MKGESVKSEKRTGHAYFSDGRVEEIEYFYKHSDEVVEFYTKSGKFLVKPYIYETFSEKKTINRFYQNIIHLDKETGHIIPDYSHVYIDKIELIEGGCYGA